MGFTPCKAEQPLRGMEFIQCLVDQIQVRKPIQVVATDQIPVFALWPSYQPKKSKFWKNGKMPGDSIILNLCTKWRSYDVSFLKYGLQQTEFFAILDHFLPFYPTNTKNQSFEKMEKKPGDIIISQKCTKNYDHMLYCSWDMMHDKCNCYFSFWAIFFHFIPITAQIIKI